ncbi:hypothetical protein ACTL6U_02175 [Rhodovibrionaceae bacterium A322]
MADTIHIFLESRWHTGRQLRPLSNFKQRNKPPKFSDLSVSDHLGALRELRLLLPDPILRDLSRTSGRRRWRNSKQCNRFDFVSLSDSTGVFEVTLFSETLGRCRDLLEGGKPLLVQVLVERQPEVDDLRLTAQDFEDLDEALAKTAPSLKIYANSTDPLSHLNAILQREGRGRGKMDLVLSLKNDLASFSLTETATGNQIIIQNRQLGSHGDCAIALVCSCFSVIHVNAGATGQGQLRGWC